MSKKPQKPRNIFQLWKTLLLAPIVLIRAVKQGSNKSLISNHNSNTTNIATARDRVHQG